ncbi:MAG: hypothetical protein GY940_04820 [bacterium]|nr:hypothetical protein [bacterium]
MQFLKYMYHQWQQDVDNGRPPRPIIPIVFYHGKEEWNVPDDFVDLFEVEDPVKPFLLNYSYILFDTEDWDFRTETDPELRENVFLLSAMALMKYTYDKNIDAIEEIIRFWKRNGFIHDTENVVFFLIYISKTQNISGNQVVEIFNRNHIYGGKIMQAWEEKIIGNAREEAIKETERKMNLKTAKKMLERGIDTDSIVYATGLSKEEVEKIAETIH